MINLISGITVTEGSKNLSSIYSKLTCNRHRSTGSRFLSSYSWNLEYVTDERIFHAIFEISNTSKDDDIGFLIIDYTLSKKDISTKHIEGLDFHNSHADGNKPMWSHCLVTSHYTIKIGVDKFSKHIMPNETSIVTASNNKYYVYRYEGKLNDIENAVVLISWNKQDLSLNCNLSLAISKLP